MAGRKFRAGISENSADASATTVQNIPDAPDISLNDVSTSMMTVHGDGLPPTRMLRVSMFPGNRMTVPWIARMPSMSTSLVWTKLQHILSMAGQQIPQESAKTRRTPDTVQNIPDSPDPSTMCPLLP
jgi:hypothetical protein